MNVTCKECLHEYPIDLCRQEGKLFVTASCPNCSTKCNQCLLCEKKYFMSSSQNDYRNIKQHIAKSHQDSQSHAQDSTVGVSVHDDSQSPAEETTVSDNVHDDTIFDDNDSCRELDENEIEGIVDQLNIEDNEYDVDFETETMYHPPPSGNITIELEDFEVFSNEKSNVYFWQEYMCQNENEMHGGLRGLVWRSMFRKKAL